MVLDFPLQDNGMFSYFGDGSWKKDCWPNIATTLTNSIYDIFTLPIELMTFLLYEKYSETNAQK